MTSATRRADSFDVAETSGEALPLHPLHSGESFGTESELRSDGSGSHE